jgi:murein DD-endopeptidase MepM/ murein hydrolase activator NlpD
VRDAPTVIRVEGLAGTVEGNLTDAVVSAGGDAALAARFADVFAWDVDFYRDVQKGDRMRAVVEKRIHKGRTLEYGRVLAAEYVGSSVGTKKSYRYKLPDGTETFFTEDGLSARKTFLKSPLKYATVTSGFGSRFHPVLNYVGNHNGVDYHAPAGTPVWAVSDGTVVRAGWDEGGGNVVCVKHVMSFESCYLHLSKILVRVGERVPQKRVLAESGNTGKLTTGPHLHFGLKRGGHWVNPLNQNFPRADPLPKTLMDDFKAQIADAAARLSAPPVAAFGTK